MPHNEQTFFEIRSLLRTKYNTRSGKIASGAVSSSFIKSYDGCRVKMTPAYTHRLKIKIFEEYIWEWICLDLSMGNL